MNDFANYQIVQKGYNTLNIGFTGNYKGFKVSLALNNLQNKIYYNYAVGSGSGVYHSASYYPLPGFNTLLKISKEF
jgi:outer membrane receptor protein involved in Fe transport